MRVRKSLSTIKQRNKQHLSKKKIRNKPCSMLKVQKRQKHELLKNFGIWIVKFQDFFSLLLVFLKNHAGIVSAEAKRV